MVWVLGSELSKGGFGPAMIILVNEALADFQVGLAPIWVVGVGVDEVLEGVGLRSGACLEAFDCVGAG